MAYLMLGIRTMLRYMSSQGGIFNPELMAEKMEECWQVIAETANQQVDEMQGMNPTDMFINTLRELIESGAAIVDKIGNAHSNQKPIGLIGYKDESYYYLLATPAYGAVNQALAKEGNSMPVSKNATLKMLAEEGKSLKDKGTGRNVCQVMKSGIHGWFVTIPRFVLDGTPKMEQVSMEDNPFVEGSEKKE